MQGIEQITIAENRLTATLLSNGEFVACVYKGLVDDYAKRAVRIIALKVFKSVRKKFSKLIINVLERQTSAWDYYCYGLAKGRSGFRDKFISDSIRLTILEKVDRLTEEKRRLIEISACHFLEINESTVLSREAVVTLVHEEVHALSVEYGRGLQAIHLGRESNPSDLTPIADIAFDRLEAAIIQKPTTVE